MFRRGDRSRVGESSVRALAVNLLPWREQRRQRCRRFWIICFVFAGVGMTFATIVLQTTARFDRQFSSLWLQSETDVLAGISLREPQFRALREQWFEQQARSLRLRMTREWHERFISLAEHMPDGAWLTHLHFRQGRLELAGLSRSFTALSELEQVLRETQGFRLQQTGSTERDVEGRWQFRYQLEREDGNAPRS